MTTSKFQTSSGDNYFTDKELENYMKQGGGSYHEHEYKVGCLY
jgi:hypothetical protein